jgi:hypothetical protein
MNRSHVVQIKEEELVALNAAAEPSFVMDEEAWEDAIDDSGVDCDLLCHSQWRSPTAGYGD